VQRYLLAASLLSDAGMVAALLLSARPTAAAMTAAAAVIAGAARPREALEQVDWSLLLFFGGLFVVMRAVEQAGLAHLVVAGIAGPLARGGPDAGTAAVGAPHVAAWVVARLGAAVALLSQAVSNVPAVMLFVPPLEAAPAAVARSLWLALAAFSTLAGNLTIIGSVANVIVFETARRDGVEVRFSEYLKVGAPLTLLTCLIAWVWLALVSGP
jgi:Na+/H+ antiporter NhaD/arsenite permease-like protein